MKSNSSKITMKKLSGLIYLFLSILFISPVFAQKLTKRKVAKVFKNSEIVNNHYTGFALYDNVTNKPIFELDANKPAIPASNTKIFTLYTALNMLGDSIPGLRYITRGDSLIFWGTGDPSFLHPDLKSRKIYDFLKNSDKKLFYSHSNSSTDFAGSAIYQIAMVSMPVIENTGRAYTDKDRKLRLSPTFLEKSLKIDTTYHPITFTVRRDEETNSFTYPNIPVPANFRQTLYLVPGSELTTSFLADTLKKQVNTLNMRLPQNAKTLFSIPSDTLYRRMMLPSDNYLAEQLLYVCSSLLPGKLSVDSAIAYSSRNFLSDLPDKFQWRDGSGLSRNNLFSPRSIIKILIKLKEKLITKKDF